MDGSWVYPTKDEAAYPPDLCHFLCQAATSAALQHPRFQAPAVKASMSMRSQVRAAASIQTKHAAPLIPEFRACVFLSQVPEGSTYKVLSPLPASISGENAEAGQGKQPKRRKGVAGSSSTNPSPGHDPSVGVYHSMEEHVAIAETLWSPFDDVSGVPDQVRSNLFRMLTEGPVAISKLRLQALQDVNARFKEIQAAEASLRAKMDPEVEAVTRGRAITLFKSLLEETKFLDLSVVQMLEQGVHLVGDEPRCPLFSKRPKPKAIDELEPEAQAPSGRKPLIEPCQR